MCLAVLTNSGCNGAAPTAGALPADQIIDMVRSTGGMVPSVYYASRLRRWQFKE